nr:hypothetical protein Itr_chr13CG04580 [Ipomoea trifida]
MSWSAPPSDFVSWPLRHRRPHPPGFSVPTSFLLLHLNDNFYISKRANEQPHHARRWLLKQQTNDQYRSNRLISAHGCRSSRRTVTPRHHARQHVDVLRDVQVLGLGRRCGTRNS